MDLVIEIERRDSWVVLHLHGEVDLTTAPRLRSGVHEALVDLGAGIVFDLDDVGLLDSTGLGVLLGAVRRVRKQGGDVRFVSTRPVVTDLFELVGLDQVHPVLPSVDDAVRTAPGG